MRKLFIYIFFRFHTVVTVKNVSGTEHSEMTHLEDVGHFALLRQRAVVLDGEDHGHLGVHESRAIDGFHHVLWKQREDYQKDTENYKKLEC